MVTEAKAEAPIGLSRETPGISHRGVPWVWVLAGIAVLVVGLMAGAAGWQATRSDTTATVQKLAERYAAAGFFTPAQAAMFAPNGKLVDETMGEWSQGHAPIRVRGPATLLYVGTVEAHMQSHHLVTYTARQRVALVGRNGFVTEWDLDGTRNLAGQAFTLHGVSVCTVKNGKITLERFYYDTRPVLGQ